MKPCSICGAPTRHLNREHVICERMYVVAVQLAIKLDVRQVNHDTLEALELELGIAHSDRAKA